MKRELLYKDFAKYYDLIYSYKDYKYEADVISRLIKFYKKNDGNELLDLACGTGSHLFYLKDFYKCTGIDKNIEMIQIAKQKLPPSVNLICRDMLQDINRNFDVIISMFSSISYLQSISNLKKVINNIYNNLEPGGVVIIQPWFERESFQTGIPFMKAIKNGSVQIARLSNSYIDGICSVLDIHFLIAEPGRKIKHYIDQHRMALFENKTIINLLKDYGMTAEYLPPETEGGRGLIIGCKSLPLERKDL